MMVTIAVLDLRMTWVAGRTDTRPSGGRASPDDGVVVAQRPVLRD